MLVKNDVGGAREMTGNTLHDDEGVGTNIRKCTFTKSGLCEVHRVPGSKVTIPTKKWKDKGGGKGFGWVTVRTKKYQCRVKKGGPEVQLNSTDAEGLRSQMLRDVRHDVGDYGADIQTGFESESFSECRLETGKNWGATGDDR